MKRMYVGFLKFLVLATIVLEVRLLALNSWTATSAEIQCIEKERQALLHFKAAFVDSCGLLSSWGKKMEKRDCCEWKGVRCSNQTGYVQKLNLPSDIEVQACWLQGKISAPLMELQYLTYLNLSWNAFHGNISSQLGSLSHLRYLDLRHNHLEGSIPYQLGNLSQLQHLDLSRNNLVGVIPHQLGNLSQLQHLDLSMNNLVGAIPHQLGNLSQLQHLDLSWNNLGRAIPYRLGNLSNLQRLYLGYNGALRIDQQNGARGEWLSGLTSLTNLELDSITHLNYSLKWLHTIAKLPSLKALSLSSNNLSDHSILSLAPLTFNSSNSLSLLDLSWNNFMSSIIFQWLMNVSANFVKLDLSGNLLEGPIPYEFGSIMNSLEYLDLRINKLRGGLKSLGNICTLRLLFLSSNHLSEELPTILQTLSGCARYSLQSLELSNNQIIGTLPDLSTFTSLEAFDISSNWLNGTIPKDLRFPPQLVSLYFASNSLKGVLTDSHFANTPNLKNLYLYNNSLLALRFSQNWVPQFQLDAISVGSCKLGPDFPKWLQTQNNFTTLDISNAGIFDTIPEWFWGLLTSKLERFNVLGNNLSGIIPNLPIRFTEYPDVYMASNHFEGPIPQFLHNASTLDLSNNKFSGLHLFLCASRVTKPLGILDLSNNQLSGQLPDCWSHFKSLVYLDLSNNNLSGAIPASIGSLHDLHVLIFRNNRFIGELPSTLRSCSNLVTLDAGENMLSGPIPSWIGIGLHQLKILILRNNNFSGSLSMHLCYVSSINFLDLSLNNLSGQILKCFKNFKSMAQESFASNILDNYFQFLYYRKGALYGESYGSNAFLMWKGMERIFKNTVLFLKGIDLSSNQLIGEIPIELGILVELVSLNLSRNQLVGKIPSEIGRLTSLDSLDLSRNHFFGPIPSSFAQIDRLAMLDLSHNHLSGKIPISTQLQSFNSSSYEENLDLCGKPLEKMCPKKEKPQEAIKFREDKHSILSKEFYWSMTFGFITGFWGIFGSILFNRSWRHAYFRFLNNLTDTIYVMVTLNATKCNRWLKNYLEELA